MTDFTLPQSIGHSHLNKIIELFQILKKGESLQIDWSPVQEITPAGWGILACLWDRVLEQRVSWKHRGLSRRLHKHPLLQKLFKLPARAALPDPGFYNFQDSQTMLVGLAGQFLPNFMDEVELWFGQIHKRSLDPDLAFSCRLTLNELMVNAIDHSTAERYYLYAGFWQQQFQVGALDMGVTIPAKLERKYIQENDADFLKLALKEGITTRRQQVGGLGLAHTFDHLKQGEGTLILLSRQAQMRRYFHHNKVRCNLIKHTLDGTWCFANFPLKG